MYFLSPLAIFKAITTDTNENWFWTLKTLAFKGWKNLNEKADSVWTIKVNYSIRITKWQNDRVWKGSLEAIWCHLSLFKDSHPEQPTQDYLDSFWISPKGETPQLLWAACVRALSPTQEICSFWWLDGTCCVWAHSLLYSWILSFGIKIHYLVSLELKNMI